MTFLCKLTASLGLYCKPVSKRGETGGAGREKLASIEPKQLEKALGSRRSLPEQFRNRGRLLPGLAWMPGYDWSSVFILDRLIGMMTVSQLVRLPGCVSLLEVLQEFWLTAETNG